MSRYCAKALVVLAAIVALAGIGMTVIIGIGMTNVIARVIVFLAGFILTAISATILVAVAQLVFLIMRVEAELADIAAKLELQKGD